MLGMREAVERVLRAVDAGERILVYGDYDVDGTTGTVVLRRALEFLGAKTGYHVPHRFTEGYGIRRTCWSARRRKATRSSSALTAAYARTSLWSGRVRTASTLSSQTTTCPTKTKARRPPTPCSTRTSAAARTPTRTSRASASPSSSRTRSSASAGARGSGARLPQVVAIGTVADVAQLTGENRAIVALG
jgi:single-stranded-DNA-specific exonuclease